MNKLVSIIIPTFNRGYLIEETFDAIQAQEYTNWECIIVDDESTDNSYKIVEEYTKKDIRFSCFKRPKTLPKEQILVEILVLKNLLVRMLCGLMMMI